MSLPEVMLWQRLRGIKFRRQHPFGRYVLDFYCPATKLAIEIDGASHGFGDRAAQDALRENFIAAGGLRIVRISAEEVLRDADDVADRIVRLALPLHQPVAGPPPHAMHGEDLVGAR